MKFPTLVGAVLALSNVASSVSVAQQQSIDAYTPFCQAQNFKMLKRSPQRGGKGRGPEVHVGRPDFGKPKFNAPGGGAPIGRPNGGRPNIGRPNNGGKGPDRNGGRPDFGRGRPNNRPNPRPNPKPIVKPNPVFQNPRPGRPGGRPIIKPNPGPRPAPGRPGNRPGWNNGRPAGRAPRNPDWYKRRRPGGAAHLAGRGQYGWGDRGRHGARRDPPRWFHALPPPRGPPPVFIAPIGGGPPPPPPPDASQFCAQDCWCEPEDGSLQCGDWDWQDYCGNICLCPNAPPQPGDSLVDGDLPPPIDPNDPSLYGPPDGGDPSQYGPPDPSQYPPADPNQYAPPVDPNQYAPPPADPNQYAQPPPGNYGNGQSQDSIANPNPAAGAPDAAHTLGPIAIDGNAIPPGGGAAPLPSH